MSALVLLAVIMGLGFVLRLKFWGQPFEMDEGLHAYMGWGLLHGLVPFRDMYNTKPPGIYFLHSLLFLVVEPTALNIKVFASIYTLGTTAAVFLLARRAAGQKAGLLAALLFAIFSCGPNIQGGGVNSEVFMVLPSTLAAYSLLLAAESGRGRDYLLFGFWTGLATTIKQVACVNLFWVAAYLAVRLLRHRSKQGLTRVAAAGLWVAAGVVLPWFAFLLYFYGHGALGKFYFWMVRANFLYIDEGYRKLPIFALFLERMRAVLSENGILWLLALAGAVWWRQEVQAGADDGRSRQGAAWILLSSWPIFSFFGVALGGRFFAHYYVQLMPPLAVLGGIGLAGMIQRLREQRIRFFHHPVRLLLAALLAATAVLFVKTDAPYYLRYNGSQISFYQYNTPLFSVTRFIGLYLRKHTGPHDLVYVWAVDPEINFYALRRSPSPFLIHVDLAQVPWNPYEEVIRCLKRSPPAYIVAMQGMSGFPALEKYVRSNYCRETSWELERLKLVVPFELYRRKT